MADILAFPGVGDVDFLVGGLDDGGVGELVARGVFDCYWRGPGFSVEGRGVAYGVAVDGGGVVDEEGAAVMELDGVDAAVGVGESGGGWRGPGLAGIRGPGFVNFLVAAAAEELDGVFRVREQRGLNELEMVAVV